MESTLYLVQSAATYSAEYMADYANQHCCEVAFADVQWSMHLQQFALIYTYAAHIMHKCKQKNMENIYI